MKSTVAALSLLALGSAAASSSYSAEPPVPQEPAQDQRVVWAVEVDPRATDNPSARTDSEVDAIANAAIVLNARGYETEAARLREIVAKMTRSDQSVERLLAADLQDKSNRLAILRLASTGYESAGWETAAEALAWLAAFGQSEIDGTDAPNTSTPKDLQAGTGSITDRMIELVLGAGPILQRQGNERAANACLKLGRFYVEREMGKFRDPSVQMGIDMTPSVERAMKMERALKEIGYFSDELAEEVPPAPKGGFVFMADDPADDGATDEAARLKALRLEVTRLRREVSDIEAQLKRNR